MKVFTIDTENNITVYASISERDQGGGEAESFSSRKSLETLAAKWPGTRLVEIWNGLPGVKPVQKFTSRAVAVRRIWAAVQHLKPASGPLTGTVASAASNTRAAAGKTPAAIAAQGAIAKNKAALVIALLKAPKGATLQDLMGATGWQAHSIRGFISGHLKKKLGLKVQSFKRDGERVYAIKG
jgi:hypothetical protein